MPQPSPWRKGQRCGEKESASAAQGGVKEHRVSGRGTQHGAETRQAMCRNATTMSMQAIVRDQGSPLLPTPCRLHAGSALYPAPHAPCKREHFNTHMQLSATQHAEGRRCCMH